MNLRFTVSRAKDIKNIERSEQVERTASYWSYQRAIKGTVDANDTRQYS